MSQFHVDNSRIKVITYPEIIFIGMIFLFVLYVLYPGKTQLKLILEEKTNYELTSVYLENMLRIDPDNIDLILATIKVSIDKGNLDLADNLMNVLKKSDKIDIQKEMNLLNFRLLEEKNKKSLIEDEIKNNKLLMIRILKRTAQEGMFFEKDALIWHDAAIYFKENESAWLFLKPLYEKKDLQALKKCAYLDSTMAYRKDKLYCLETLGEFKNSEQWLNAAYAMYIEDGNNEKALEIIKKLSNINPKYQDELARMQQLSGNLRESADIYILLSSYNDEAKKKKYYLSKAIEIMVGGSLNSDAVALMQKYEDDYIDDDEFMQYFISLYLSMNELESARKLSIKLLTKEEE